MIWLKRRNPRNDAGSPFERSRERCYGRSRTRVRRRLGDSAAAGLAIAAANPGDRLNVFGRCRGSFSIEKDLRLFGNTNRQAPTVLDGAGGTGGTGVLFVNEREHPDPEPHHGQRQRPRRLRLLTGPVP